tara:strand:+ start:201 stop:851 length:651 start_codon:yes stop_codon:yes gene_type:complete
MNINEVLDKSSRRIERKIILKKGQAIFILPDLKEYGFTKVHQSRRITSIYLDDINLNSLRDNIDGNRNRNKIRIRYYNNEIENFFIEIKQKRGFIGYKKRINFNNVKFSTRMNLVDYVISWCKNEFQRSFYPKSEISYNRSYFQKNEFRATVDTNINSTRLSTTGKSLNTSINDYEVIEFKYSPEHDEMFRLAFPDLTKKYVRATKSSKYSNSLMF